MYLPLKPKSFLQFLPPFASFSSSNLIWVSHFSSKSPQFLSESKTHLANFFNSINIQSGNRNSNKECIDHELELVSALKSCSFLQSIFQGQQIHSLIVKSGLDSNIFIQNSIISMYVKCNQIGVAKKLFDSCSRLDSISCNIMLGAYLKSGMLGDALQLFDVMPDRGGVAYTTMIMGLAQSDRWSQAISIFKGMRVAGVAPNEVTMASVISSYTRVGRISDGRALQALTTKLGLKDFVLVSTNLLHLYCVKSSLEDARRLFDEMPEKNIVSWNVMLNGYSKAKFVDLARDLFDNIPERDLVSWGTIVDAYVQVDRLVEALTLYRSMLSAGLRPNDVMVVDLVSGCGRVVAIGEGQQLHSTIVKAGFNCYDFIQSTIIHFYSACGKINLACLQFEEACQSHLASWNALISGFIRNGMIQKAQELFDRMPERDIFSWSSMISGYSHGGQASMALELFRGMVAVGVQPNEITMVSVLSAIASVGALKEAKWAHEFIRNNSIPLNDNLIAALIDVYAKCGSISNALDVFNPLRPKITSISPWNAMICGLAMHGHATLSLRIFEDLEKTGIQPNAITFIGVLTACCHAGLVEAGEKYFESIKNVYQIDPNIKHYGCMVDLLGRAGKLQEAEAIIESMPMQADVVIWGTLLAACRTHGNVEVGERAAKILRNLDTSHGASRVLLSNLYADAGRWNDAIGVRKSMQGEQMVRLPGASFA
ncbi:LOW QUALITY PROTEIN: pentatricopeptide repeat-containing protein At5g19020, mitochondrial-like [Chenopodium quinoa]|uniref:LOW QUALITY PROTEIN: pentatricopeptide repeat-containing protein At5g19020, mitochondrial-like n=1 Tax=Chenopodium quinoa TaxID=63459 RepID=UPI000B77C41D|nr:LOW QUALITY PROTEIN: pentatricopeptide repeat-containing protein At5g19020, mitochondrial-like [Chenopodium quinoa]